MPRSEIIIASEASQLFLRNPRKHARRIAGLYLISFLGGQELGNLARSGYYLARRIDDVLDGDRKIAGNPKDYALRISEEIQKGEYSKNSISQLAQHTLQQLERRARPSDNPRQDWINLINSMVFDYDRAQQKRVLSKEELERYYAHTFIPPLNIMLIGFQSRLRASDMPQLAQCMGRVYSILDFTDDWLHGIINIPSDILEVSGLTTDHVAQEVAANPLVKQWFQKELSDSRKDLVALQKNLKYKLSIDEPLTLQACNERINHMLGVIRSKF